MIFRLTQKLAKKIKVTPAQVLPLDPNPYADWTARLFTADRTQIIILTNTASLYSLLMPGRGIANESQFIDRSLDALRKFIVDDGSAFIFAKQISPATDTVHFSKSLNRSVDGSMNDLVFQAKYLMIERGLSPYETSFQLNEAPMGALKYRSPWEAFRTQQVDPKVAAGN